jgi:large repetitive protein
MRFGWLILLLSLIGSDVPVWSQGTPAFFMGSGKTGEKPQAKVWFHDGIWWCLLPGTEQGETALRFYQLHHETWQWIGDVVDTREDVQADVWAEGNDLFVLVFHPKETRFLSFYFEPSKRRYILREGFPVTLSPLPVGGVETMSLRRDGQGRFWAVFEGESKDAKRGSVWAIWSDDGLFWQLNGVRLGTNVAPDDIATLCHFVVGGTGHIGAIWSQQSANKSTHRDSAGVSRLIMRIHKDGDAPTQWSPIEEIASGQALGDDHLNTAVARDGRIYLVTKTSLDDLRPKDLDVPLLMLYVRSGRGEWTGHTVSKSTERGTRPIVTLDEERGLLHVFYTIPTNKDQSERAIVHRSSDRAKIKFTEWDKAISENGTYLNDATSAHHGMTFDSGILVMCWGTEHKKNTPNRAYFRVYKLDSG